MNEAILAWMAGGAAFLTLVLVAAAFGFFSDGTETRVSRRLLLLRRRWVASSDAPAEAGTIKRDNADSLIPGFDRLIKNYVPRPDVLRARLRQTGRPIRLGSYLIACLLVGVASYAVLDLSFGFPDLVNGLFAIAIGVAGPWKVVNRMVARRINKFTESFPGAIDLIVRGLRSGLPVMDSIKAVGNEFDGPVGEEFREVTEAVRLGQAVEDALWEAARRLETPEFKFFIISLSVQRETGGNLAETLDNLSDILRRRRQMKLKIRALSSEARASAYIIGALPFLMFAIIYLMNADYAMQLFTDPRGKFLVGAGFVTLGIGAAVMARMVRFEI